MSIEKKCMAKIAINKCLLKEYGSERAVYMKDGDQFQIQLFNPETYTVGAKVVIEGDDIGGIIVLRPGERVWLERYVGQHRKFKFSTYEIDGSDKDAVNAIRNNGTVKVEFYKEDRGFQRNTVFIRSFEYPGSLGNNVFYNGNGSGFKPTDITFSSDELTTITTSSCDTAGAATLGAKFGLGDNAAGNARLSNNANVQSSMVETGKVEAGDWSSQEMNQVDTKFCTYPFKTETMKILPKSQKPVGSKDLAKIYCPYCGHKVKQKFKFCPFCGKKID